VKPYILSSTSKTSHPSFGSVMIGREFEADTVGKYRYGFNGKENDNVVKGTGNSIAFEERIYDSQLGRFFSTDPRESEYAWQSTYCYFKNSPIGILDLLGGGGPYQEESNESKNETKPLTFNLTEKAGEGFVNNPQQFLKNLIDYAEKSKNGNKYIITGETLSNAAKNSPEADKFFKGNIKELKSISNITFENGIATVNLTKGSLRLKRTVPILGEIDITFTNKSAIDASNFNSKSEIIKGKKVTNRFGTVLVSGLSIKSGYLTDGIDVSITSIKFNSFFKDGGSFSKEKYKTDFILGFDNPQHVSKLLKGEQEFLYYDFD